MKITNEEKARVESLQALQKERALQAKKTYCSACEEFGVKACPWESFSGYKDYVDGKINESELALKAAEELKDLTKTFGKYTVLEKAEQAAPGGEEEKEERAKAASKVYRKICSESGLDRCFFSNFTTWSDFVQGRIDQSEFSQKARLEVERMRASDN